jgi:tRNA A37 threonylcarbamoyladenosine modification protein TsaB
MVSALEALAHVAASEQPLGAAVGAWMDAHRGDVFSALYCVTDAPAFTRNRLREILEPRVATPSETIAAWPTPDTIVGDGAQKYADVIRKASSRIPIAPAPLLAAAIGRVALSDAALGRGGVDPAGLQPLYVRRPDAEIDRERRNRA